ncbi:MAG: hypothetical protein PHI48_05865 [Bacteroidales bacterium]|nr:hypothetical protein [Bacteroidales bacterium]MDD4822067.1 hypothetical protein [Bacteroidales bacterium]
MKKWLRKNVYYFLGASCGGAVGYLYYYFIGYKSDSSLFLTSSGMSIVWGVALGLLIVNLFRKQDNYPK